MTRDELGVLGLSTHENMLLDFCQIASNSNNVTVFTTQDILHNIGELVESDIELISKKESENLYSFLKRIERRSENLDTLWIFPLYGNLLNFIIYANFSPQTRTVLTIYDSNAWIGRHISFTPKVFNYAKYPLRRKILSNIDTIVTEYNPIRKYAEKHIKNNNIEVFTPVLFRGGDLVSTSNDKFVITVPGIIDKSRRDYSIILDALTDLPPHISHDLSVVLLGPPKGKYGSQTIENFTQIQQDGMDLTYYEDWIPVKEYSRQIRRSDLLISPLKKRRIHDGFMEFYGLTKGSGVLFDGIRNAVPVALPEWYIIPDKLSDSAICFENVQELSYRIKSIVGESHTRTYLEQQALKTSHYYNLNQQSKNLEKIIE